MGPDSRAGIRQELWQSFESEADASVRRKVCHAMAKASEGWTELLNNLVTFLVSTLAPLPLTPLARSPVCFFLS